MGREEFPEILSQGFAWRAISKWPFQYKQDLPGPILSYYLDWLRASFPPPQKHVPKKAQKAGWCKGLAPQLWRWGDVG